MQNTILELMKDPGVIASMEKSNFIYHSNIKSAIDGRQILSQVIKVFLFVCMYFMLQEEDYEIVGKTLSNELGNALINSGERVMNIEKAINRSHSK